MADFNSDIKNIIHDILLKYSKKKIKAMQAILYGKGKIARGILVRSFKEQILKDEKLNVTFAGYGKYVDEGRRSGKAPPLKSIKEWCRVKGIPEEYAFVIAKKISERGTKPVNFIRAFFDGIEELSQEVADQFSEEICIALKQEIESMFKK